MPERVVDVCAPRTLNREYGPGASTAAYAATGSDTSAEPNHQDQPSPHPCARSCAEQIFRACAHDPFDGLRACASFPSCEHDRSSPPWASRQPGRHSRRCTYPSEVDDIPVDLGITHQRDQARESADIDRAVREALAERRPAVCGRRRAAQAARSRRDRHPGPVRGLHRLERRGRARLAHRRRDRLARSPRDLEEIEDSIRTLARHLGAAGSRRAAGTGHVPPHQLHSRLVRGTPRRRGLVAEWLDPPFAAGRWVPEISVGPRRRRRGARAPRGRWYATTWEDVRDAAPQLIMLTAPDFDLERTVAEQGTVPRHGRTHRTVDSDAAYSRPGPRVAEIARLAHLLPSDDVEAPELRCAELSTPSASLPCSDRTVAAVPVGGSVAATTSGSRALLLGDYYRRTPVSAIPATARACSSSAPSMSSSGRIAIVQRLSHDAQTRRVTGSRVVDDLDPDGSTPTPPETRTESTSTRNFPWRWRPRTAPGTTYYAGPDRCRSPEPLRAARRSLRLRPEITILFPGRIPDRSSTTRAAASPIEAHFARPGGAASASAPALSRQCHDLAGPSFPEGHGVRRRVPTRPSCPSARRDASREQCWR